MFAPARIPVAEGKKMENMPKKLPFSPRQSGTKLAAKISAFEGKKKGSKTSLPDVIAYDHTRSQADLPL